jgi:hypothetical protein
MKRDHNTFMMALFFVSLTLILTSCGGGGGSSSGAITPPLIFAELDSFPTGSVPPGLVPSGFNSMASVYVIEDNSGDPMTNAAVIMNGITLTYNAANQDYEGYILINPSDNVTLSVSVAGNMYTVSGTQFASYPIISAPVSGATWPTRCATTFSWSRGSQVANAYYGLGILDASNPNGQFIWPSSGYLQNVQIGTTSFSIAAGSLTAGNRFAIVGISINEPISNAAPGSILSIGGYNYASFSLSDVDMLFNITVNPASLAVPKGATQQFTATGSYCTNGSLITQDLTTSATWTSDPNIAFVSNVSGLNGKVTSTGTGTTLLTATSGTVSGSASLTVSEWAIANSGTTYDLYGVAWNGTTFVAVGDGGSVLTSPDAITWTPQSLTNATSLRSVVWSGSQFVAVGLGVIQVFPNHTMPNIVIFTSPDGAIWTEQSLGNYYSNYPLNDIIWSGLQFIAVGPAGSILTSPDGITWTERQSPFTSGNDGIAWSGSTFVAVGEAGEIAASSDGITWTEQILPNYPYFYGVVWSGGQFIAVGQDIQKSSSAIFTSPDGLTWTQQSTGIAQSPNIDSRLCGAASSGQKLVAVGMTQISPTGDPGPGIILTSSNGITWTQPTLGMTNPKGPFNGVAWFGTRFVVVGANGTIYLSP